MSYNVPCVFSSSLASGVTLGSSIGLGSGWDRAYLHVPTMASGDLFIQGSHDGTTFNRVCRDRGNTATVHADFAIGSATSNRVIPIPVNGIPYIKIENSSGCTDVVTVYKIICS